MKTNLNFYENTILDSINFEGYNLPDNQTDFEKIINVYKIFIDEYIHENNKHLPLEKLFCEWLQGLPSCLNIPFMNYEILENAKNAGFFNVNLITHYPDNTRTEKEVIATGESLQRKENYFLDNYFINLSMAFFKSYEQKKIK
jgi:hypothetical protein